MSNIALIAAAGSGVRLKNDVGKMMVKIFKKPLITYTLDEFERSDKIDEIFIIIRSQDSKILKREVFKKNIYRKLTKIVSGGLTRQESVYNGLMAIEKNHSFVCIHDGARPLIDRWMIEKVLNIDRGYDGAILAVPIVETIKKILPDNMIVEKTVNRDEYWIAQTPQCFQLDYIINLHKRAKADGVKVNDDASIVEHYGGKIKIIPGARENIKITTPVDLALVEILLKNINDKHK